ncbi:hypothetical protein V2J09_023102 [Rumex salicifolius]
MEVHPPVYTSGKRAAEDVSKGPDEKKLRHGIPFDIIDELSNFNVSVSQERKKRTMPWCLVDTCTFQASMILIRATVFQRSWYHSSPSDSASMVDVAMSLSESMSCSSSSSRVKRASDVLQDNSDDSSASISSFELNDWPMLRLRAPIHVHEDRFGRVRTTACATF